MRRRVGVSLAVIAGLVLMPGARAETGSILVPVGEVSRVQRCAQSSGVPAAEQGVVGYTVNVTAGKAFSLVADDFTDDFSIAFLKENTPCAEGANVTDGSHENVIGDEYGIVPAGATVANITLDSGKPGAKFTYSESTIPAGHLSPQTSDVVIAVIDTGLRATHQEFDYCDCGVTTTGVDADLSDQIAAWWDFSRENPGGDRLSTSQINHPEPGQTWDDRIAHPYDNHYHGTAVASLAAGRNADPVKDAAFAPGFKLAIAKVGEGSGSISGNITEALNWAVDTVGADVVTMSIGALIPLPEAFVDFHEAAGKAREKGVLVVVANGNGLAGTALAPAEPGWSLPYGNSTNVLAVGATGNSHALEIQGGKGATPEPEVTAKFNPVMAATISKEVDDEEVPCDDCYDNTGGTSFSAPRVAGIAARLIHGARANGKDDSPDRIEKLIKFSARDTGTPPYDEGYGKLDYQETFAALAHAKAGTVPARPDPDLNQIWVEQVSGSLRKIWTEQTELSKFIEPTNIPPGNGQGVIGPSSFTGFGEGEVYSLSAAAGDVVTVDLEYVLDPNLDFFNDIDVYVFRGSGPSFSSTQEVAHSTNSAAEDESLSFTAEITGTYSVVVLAWTVANDQAFTLTSSKTLTFESEDYRIHTYGNLIY